MLNNHLCITEGEGVGSETVTAKKTAISEFIFDHCFFCPFKLSDFYQILAKFISEANYPTPNL